MLTDADAVQIPVIHALDPLSQLLGEDSSHHQAKAPLDQVGNTGNQRAESHRLFRRFGDSRQVLQQLPEDGGISQAVAQHHYQNHLHGEPQKAPEAVAPMDDHAQR